MELGMPIPTRGEAARLPPGALLATLAVGALAGVGLATLGVGPAGGWAASTPANLAAGPPDWCSRLSSSPWCSGAKDLAVVAGLFKAWGAGELISTEAAAKYYANDAVIDATAAIDFPLYKMYYGLDGVVELCKNLALFKFDGFMPTLVAGPGGTILSKNTVGTTTLLSTGASIRNQSDYLEFTMKDGKIAGCKFYFGDQMAWKGMVESETIGLVGGVFAAWGAGKLNSTKEVAKYFTDDVAIDATAAMDFPIYKMYHGLDGVVEMVKNLELLEFEGFVPHLVPGPGGTVMSKNIVKKTSVAATGASMQHTADYEEIGFKDGKISSLKFYWGNQPAYIKLFESKK